MVDADGGAEAGDEVDVGFIHDAEKHAGVARERFDVAALAFSVDSVEGEGRFAAAGEAGNDDEFVARDIEVDALEVVGPSTADFDVVLGIALGATLHTDVFFAVHKLLDYTLKWRGNQLSQAPMRSLRPARCALCSTYSMILAATLRPVIFSTPKPGEVLTSRTSGP